MNGHTDTVDLDGLVDRYLDIWNDTDPVARREKIDTLFAGDGRYVDPLATARGRGEFDELVAGAQRQFAGLTFRRGHVFDAHHDLARFTWELATDRDAEPIAVGFDVVEVDGAGRIHRVSGFLDVMPA
ncbi:nuclear transport factor 2 family protein [Williamsia herbipolensis]|uniref:Nuclear transport factor 2 family protein n=1 Tax=Williamsia herbipolensis TaxID=1603258 RepID=A0AAU4K4B8_9NOCA|nr:nuclear transport factor 2 family protein [Williamsia herbipolensis]